MWFGKQLARLFFCFSHDLKHLLLRNGAHLEHFHSYHKPVSSTAGRDENEKDLSAVADETIDLHTDQGLFIVFTPGLMVTHLEDGNSTSPLSWRSPMDSSLRPPTGIEPWFDFPISMYINPKLHYDTISQSRKLRATPHSVGLATQNFSKTRTWFGLMILSPADAYSEKDGRSYGELRHLLATSPIEDIPGRLGCSSVEHRALDGDESNDDCEEGYQLSTMLVQMHCSCRSWSFPWHMQWLTRSCRQMCQPSWPSFPMAGLMGITISRAPIRSKKSHPILRYHTILEIMRRAQPKPGKKLQIPLSTLIICSTWSQTRPLQSSFGRSTSKLGLSRKTGVRWHFWISCLRFRKHWPRYRS